MDALRAIGSLEWVALLIVLTPATFRFALGKGRPLDKLWAPIWFGALNRIAFNGVNTYLPGDKDALMFCHVQADIVGAWVLVVVLVMLNGKRNA